MAYPPAALAADKANSTSQFADHPAHHNAIANAINDIVAELGTNPSQGSADVTTLLAGLGRSGSVFSFTVSEIYVGTGASGAGGEVFVNLGSHGSTVEVGVLAAGAPTSVAMAVQSKGTSEVNLRGGAGLTFLRGGDNAGVTYLGFHDGGAQPKQAITGSRGGNAALASLLTKLALIGLVTDSTT